MSLKSINLFGREKADLSHFPHHWTTLFHACEEEKWKSIIGTPIITRWRHKDAVSNLQLTRTLITAHLRLHSQIVP